jgi:hypothetical protein
VQAHQGTRHRAKKTLLVYTHLYWFSSGGPVGVSSLIVFDRVIQKTTRKT